MHLYSRETNKWNRIQSNIGVKNHGTMISDSYIGVTRHVEGYVQERSCEAWYVFFPT